MNPFHCDNANDPEDPPLVVSWDFEDDIYTSDPPIDGRWIRLAGDGGDILEFSPPGGRECGFQQGFWVSQWDPADGVPPVDYDTPGTLPAASDGVKPMTVRLWPLEPASCERIC